jgi:predicted 2-oxoglutarate/Fe(II)-dependent dioxygenase YbiX
MLFNIVDPAEKDYLNMYGISFNDHEQYSLLKYGEGQKFINHIDDYKEGPRRISLVYYINDDYVGGEIKFPRFGITYKPKANDLIIFPSTYVYNHSVNPVISGTRYAVASWIN